MFKKVVSLLSVAVLPILISTSALAQSDTPIPSAPSPYELTGTSISGSRSVSQGILSAPVPFGATAYKTESGVYIYPMAFLAYGYNDNVTLAATGQIQSSFVHFVPEMVAELKNKGDRYTARVYLDSTRYMSSADDNANASLLEFAGDNYFSSRASVGWALARVNGFDPRGSTDRVISAEPDKWHSNNINGRFIYGAQEASGRFEFDLGHQVKTYDNNRENTAIADLTLDSFAGRFYYRLGTRTQALIEYRDAKANYASDLSTESNSEHRYYAGLTWEATANTTGIVKVGRMTKDFESAGTQGASDGSWEAAVRWTPRTFTQVDLQTSRSTADSTGFGDYRLLTSTNLVWQQKWTKSLGSSISAGVLGTIYGGTGRVDNAVNFGFKVDYAVLRWLQIGLDFARVDNSSNDAAAAYKRNLTALTLTATL